MTDLLAFEEAGNSGAVARRPALIVRGAGAKLWDADGKEYLDLAGAHGWAALGHAHPAVTEAIRRQAGILVTHTESSYNDQRALWFHELGEVLATRLGTTAQGAITRIHPSSSGTEANEAAIKLARALTGRPGIVAALRGFHGRTLGALSATANPKYRTPFEPLVPGFTHVPLNDLAALDAAVTATTAAVILEVIQGEGGVRFARPEFLAAARRLCDERGALLVFDEIQTGLGRTGAWFAAEHVAVWPDVVTLGKPLGGGIPMGATCWRQHLGRFATATHGSTFGGNPLACAASRAVLRAMRDEQLPERARRLGRHALSRLESIHAATIRDVRGQGLMIGIELSQKVTPVLKRLMDRGIWGLPAGETVLRLLPPLVITEEELDRGLDAIEEVLGAG